MRGTGERGRPGGLRECFTGVETGEVCCYSAEPQSPARQGDERLTSRSRAREETGRFAKGLIAWIGFVQRYPVGTVLLCLSLAAWSAYYSLTRLEIKTARTDLIDPNDPNVQNWKRYNREFGAESDIVVVVGGREPGMMVAAVETIASEIQAFPNHFEKLCYRLDVARLKSKGLYQLPVRELEAIRDGLSGLRPALVGSWDWLTVEGMARRTLVHVENLPASGAMDEPTRASVLATARLLESLAGQLDAGRIYRSPWQSPLPPSAEESIKRIPEHFFSPDQRFAFLRVAPKESDDPTFLRNHQSVRILRDLLTRMRTVYPDLEFGLTGLPVLETDEMQAAKLGSQRSILVSSVCILLIFVTAFRAWRHPLLAMGSLAVAGCWTMGFVTATVGHLNILSASFIVTLVGLGIDYGILWITGFEQAFASGKSAARANFEVARTTGSGTLIGAATTALAFLTSLFSGFLGLVELGWIAAWGVVFCLAASMTLLPALLVMAGSTKVSTPPRYPADRALAGPVARWPHAVAVVLVLGAGVLIAGLPRLSFDYNLLNLQARGLPSVAWEHRIIQETGTSGWYALSMANSAEEARRLAEEFQTLPSVGRVVEIASLIPRDQPAKLPLIQSIHDALVGLPEPGNLPVLKSPSGPDVLAAIDALVKAGSQASLRANILVARLVRAAHAVRAQLASLPIAEQANRLAKYQSLWIEDLVLQLARLRAVSHPEPVSVRDLPESLVERFYSQTGKWAIQVFAKGSVWDMGPLQRFRDELSAIDPQVTGKPISTLHSLQRMTDGFRTSGIIALLAVFVVLWMDLRRLRYALAAMTPLLIGGTAMFGALGWLGIGLNPANLIALPLILGIGVDYGVHVLHDYRNSSGRYVLGRGLGKALLLNAMTTMASFASLALAPHWGMVTIGIALSIGVACCTLLAVLFLPAMLAIASRNRPVLAEIPVADLPSTVYYREAA